MVGPPLLPEEKHQQIRRSEALQKPLQVSLLWNLNPTDWHGTPSD